MGKRAFVITGDHAAVIANDVWDFRYRAAAHLLPVGAQATAQGNAHAETQFLIDDGVVEFMVGGASSMVLAGDFVRVPVGVPYAYRNAGDTDAHLLCRTTSPLAVRRAISILGTHAA